MSWQQRGPDPAPPEDGNTVTLASDGDRDAAAGVLSEAFAEGRLTADEHAERVREAYSARTWRELARLTADLPGPAATTGPQAAGAPKPDWCLLCALLILCPPAGIAWLLAARRCSCAGLRHPVTAGGSQPVSAAHDVARPREGWRAEDR